MRIKRTWTVILIALMIFSLVGCQAVSTTDQTTAETETIENAIEDSPTGQEGTDDLFRVAFICKGYSDTFCLNVMNAFKVAAEDYKDLFTVEYFDGELDANTHNNLIETCTANGFDAIVFQQVDAEAPVSVVKAALDAGVYVIVTTGHIEDGGASWYVDADPYQQGQVLIDYAIEKGYCDSAEIAILRGVAGNFHAENRFAAFTDALSEKADATVVDDAIANWSKNEAMTVTENWLVAYPELDVILASCDDMALGAAEATQIAGRDDQVKIFAIDGTDAGLQALKDGILMAEVIQDVEAYAVEAIKITAQLLNGEEAESIQIESKLVTPENVDEYLN